MSNSAEPLAALEPNGKASVLLYDLPNPTSYSGRQLVDVKIPAAMFSAGAGPAPAAPVAGGQLFPGPKLTSQKVHEVMADGCADADLFPNLQNTSVKCSLAVEDETHLEIRSNVPVSKEVAAMLPNEVSAQTQLGKQLVMYKSMYGTLKYRFVKASPKPIPRLMLVETYSLSSFAGAYGAGRVINTSTLLPGEHAKISVHTYQRNTTAGSNATSILDSFSQESADDFEQTLQSEQSSQSEYEESFNYYADASCEPLWGLLGIDISGGVSGGTNSARQDFAKMVSSSTVKHSQRASAKREVQINATYSESVVAGQETSVVREIANPNQSRALNFIFRQLNQEFVSFLHLTDIKVGFFNGLPGSRREVPIWNLESLLKDVIVPQKVATVKKMILDELRTILDYQGIARPVIVDRVISGNTKLPYWDSSFTSVYVDPLTGKKIELPGVIVSVFRSVMRTDGVIVESVLSIGDALDDYQERLQEAEVREKELHNRLRQAVVDRNVLGIDIVKAKEKTEADIFEEVFPRTAEPIGKHEEISGNGSHRGGA